jgi:hypothetical protein
MDSANQEVIVIDQRPENWGDIPNNEEGYPYLSYHCDAPTSPDTMVNFSVKNGNNELKGKIPSNYIYNQLQNAFHLTKTYIKTYLTEEKEIPEDVILQNSIENIEGPIRPGSVINDLYSIIDRLARQSGRLASIELLEGLIAGTGENDIIRAVENYTLQQQQEISKPISSEALSKFERFIITKDFLETVIQSGGEREKSEDESSYQKVITKYREDKNTSLICSMCQDSLQEGQLAISLPCKNVKTGEDTPHYFHAFDEKDPEVCIGGKSVEEWLKENNTCPCCRYEFPEDSQKTEEKKQQPNTSEDFTQFLQNYMSTQRQQLSQPCQCERCQENRRRRNMTESERMEDDMIQEAIRRSTMINDNSSNAVEGQNEDNSITNEVEDLERAIQMSLLEQSNNNAEEDSDITPPNELPVQNNEISQPEEFKSESENDSDNIQDVD